MEFGEFFKFNSRKELPKTENRMDFENEDRNPEIRAINSKEIGEIAYFMFKGEEAEIEETLTEYENNECLQKIISAYESFPEEIKRLFRYKARGIYYMPNQYKTWSGKTFQSKEEYGKSVVILNAKAVRVRKPSFVLIHELGHVDDYETYPAVDTPRWAWNFVDKFEKEILREEPNPIEGNNRDKENLFGDRREEWASRLAATIISIYLPDHPVTGLAIYPYTAEEFKKSYPRSFKFFKKYLKQLTQEMKTKL